MNTFFASLGLAYIALIIAAIAGWVMNIYTLFQIMDGGWTVEFVARLAGIVIGPFGAVLGYF